MKIVNTLLISTLILAVFMSGITASLVIGSTSVNTLFSTSGTINYNMRSIQKGNFAGFMTWDGVWMAQQAFDFAKANFNTMTLGSYQWNNYPVSAIQSFKDAGMTLYGYTRLAQVEYSPNPDCSSPDWPEVNTHESWFIHDAVTGGRIWNPSDNGFLMDIGNPEFRQHWITFIRDSLNAYQGFSGIFIDNTIGTINAGWIPWVRFTDSGAVTFKTSDLNNWHTNVVNFLAQIKAAFPDKKVIINMDGNYSDYVSQADGVMIEGFVHANYQSATQFSSQSSVMSQIDYYNTLTSSGKIVWYYSGTASGTTAQINSLVKYCYAGALIANNNPNSPFEFNDWFSFDNSHGYYPIMDTQIGQPTAAYYQSQNIHMRDYTAGKVLFNPTSNTYTINLATTYHLNGVPVTTVTMAGHSGEILVK